ncbi:MAG: hypothetical protein JXR95_14820 [Deltaproteobacteria bacterium]|nr:hypothetical protein [Deltaproteobacteria bacterium]
MGRTVVCCILGITLMGGSACKEKVDCEKLKQRLTSCMMDNYSKVNPSGRPLEKKEFAADKKSTAASYAEAIDSFFVEKCSASSGRDSRAKNINKCLEASSCVDVHACLKTVLK